MKNIKLKPIQRILKCLPDAEKTIRGWRTNCTAHNDGNKSLSIFEKDNNNVKLYCKKGCQPRSILSSINLNIEQLYYNLKIPNKNHPQKGSTIRVDPIIKLDDIAKIKDLLKNNYRNYCLFILGINTNLRAIDLCQIKVEQVRDLDVNDEIELRERKTKKIRRITLNESCIKAIHELLNSRHYQDDQPLILSQRGNNALKTSAVNGLVKQWCKKIGLKGNYGSHTLRKTWGYHQHHTFKTPLPLLMDLFNHSSQRQTLDYLCIQPEEKKAVYKNIL
ncbi:tyrosine-type recombinase/integrase [Candidatus Latescibacterota bacterium]